MSAQHTPGPWTLGKDDGVTCLVSSEDERIARVFCGNSLDNARLIAAAPDLLDALQWLVDLMPDPELDIDTVQREQVIKAKAVIAKATGGQA